MTYLFMFLMIAPIVFSTFRHLLGHEPSRTEGYVYGSASGGLFTIFVLSVSDAVPASESITGVSILLSFAYAAMCAAALLTVDGE